MDNYATTDNPNNPNNPNDPNLTDDLHTSAFVIILALYSLYSVLLLSLSPL